MSGTPHDDRGLALVSVLWIGAVLGLLAHGVVTDTTIAVRAERNAWARAVMERDAEAALALALLALTDTREHKRWKPDGNPRQLEYEGARFEIVIQDELGKIDINTADDGLLQKLFTNIGLTSKDAFLLCDRILYWRSAVSVGKGGPRPFERIEDLLMVEGVTPALFTKMAPALTVYSQARSIDPQVATRQALLALPGVEAAEADKILAERNYGDLPPQTQWATRAYSVQIKVRRGDGLLQRTAVLRLTPAGRKPYLLLAWNANGP